MTRPQRKIKGSDTLIIRQDAYRALFAANVEHELLTEVCNMINKRLILGNEKFKDEVEQDLKSRARPGNIGRPKNNAVPVRERKDQVKMLL